MAVTAVITNMTRYVLMQKNFMYFEGPITYIVNNFSLQSSYLCCKNRFKIFTAYFFNLLETYFHMNISTLMKHDWAESSDSGTFYLGNKNREREWQND